jgi:hypothetical protein
MEDMVKVFSADNGFNAHAEIASLEAKGLVFQESDRYFSLVLDGEHGSQTSEAIPYAIGDVRYAAKALYGGTVVKASAQKPALTNS